MNLNFLTQFVNLSIFFYDQGLNLRHCHAYTRGYQGGRSILKVVKIHPVLRQWSKSLLLWQKLSRKPVHQKVCAVASGTAASDFYHTTYISIFQHYFLRNLNVRDSSIIVVSFSAVEFTIRYGMRFLLLPFQRIY